MTPQEQINSFLNYWKDSVVDPEHYPKIFEYQLKLWKYYTSQNQKE